MFYKNSSGDWKSVSGFKYKDSNGNWRDVAKGFIKQNGTWRLFWGGGSLGPVDLNIDFMKVMNYPGGWEFIESIFSGNAAKGQCIPSTIEMPGKPGTWWVGRLIIPTVSWSGVTFSIAGQHDQDAFKSITILDTGSTLSTNIASQHYHHIPNPNTNEVYTTWVFPPSTGWTYSTDPSGTFRLEF